MTTFQRIESMNDFQILRFFDYFSTEIFNHTAISIEKLLSNLPAEVQLMPEILALTKLDDTVAGTAMKKQEAASLVRLLLLEWAKDAHLSKILAKALENYKDTAQSVEVILAIGAALSMVLMTLGKRDLQFQGFGVTIKINSTKEPDKIAVQNHFNSIPEATSILLADNKNNPILQLLRQNKVEEALNQLENSPQGPSLTTEITLLMSRYNTWRGKKGLYSSNDEEQRTYNILIHDIVQTVL
jgi:hypothetical protein